MGLAIGIVGLPNVGKSTLFNALTQSHAAESANYPFCTIDPNVGIVEVPDERLTQLAALHPSEKTIPTAIEFVDIAGLVKGASTGEGLGNKFLANIRETDAICQVVRDFIDPDIQHVAGTPSPADDIETIQTELMLADLATVTRKLPEYAKKAKTGDKLAQQGANILEKIQAALEAGQLANTVELATPEERLAVRDLHLLTVKPFIYVANVAEDAVASFDAEAFRAKAKLPAEAKIVAVSARIESELIDLSPEEAATFLADLGQTEPGLNRLIRTAYETLGLITFFTVGPKEARAWTVHRGATAPEAAGVIHTDFQRGFIRAEIVAMADLLELDSEAAARSAGKLRSEGKEYVMHDGDVCNFRFNV